MCGSFVVIAVFFTILVSILLSFSWWILPVLLIWFVLVPGVSKISERILSAIGINFPDVAPLYEETYRRYGVTHDDGPDFIKIKEYDRIVRLFSFFLAAIPILLGWLIWLIIRFLFR